MNPLWFPSVLPATVIVSLVIIARLLTRSWTHPATLFPTVWTVHVLLPIIFAPELPIYPSGLWAIVAFCVAVQIGAATAGLKAPRADKARAEMIVRILAPRLQPVFLTFVIGSIVIGAIYAYFAIDSGHRSLSALMSLSTLTKLARTESVYRYSHPDYRPSMILQFLSSAIYFSGACGGVICAFRRRTFDLVISLLSLLPGAFLTATQTTKGTLLASGLIWLASFIACSELTGKRPSTVKVIAIALIIVVFLGGLLGTAELMRAGTTPSYDAVMLTLHSDRVTSTIFGHMAVFSYWFNQYGFDTASPGWGSLTVAGPISLLNIKHRSIGVYSESIHTGSGSSQSNVYTYFRGLIEDFTVPGTLILLAVGGWIGGFGYRLLCESRPIGVPIVLIFNFFAFWYAVSIFTYNTFIVSCVAFALCWSVLVIRARTSPKAYTKFTAMAA